VTPHATIETVWRIEAPRLIGGLMRFTRDLGEAEDLAQDALVAALERWPSTGIPDNPGAWLMTTAKHRALDALRRRAMTDRKHALLAHDAPAYVPNDTLDPREAIDDDVLRLLCVACHPVLSRDAQVALTLRLVAGLSIAEIARAFLVSEPTMAQRVVRAKRTLTEARVPFEVPHGPERAARIPAVCEVVYLVFNEGYAASAGEGRIRPALCREALRLGRMLAALVPDDGEVRGLVALMALQASRIPARTDAQGRPVLLLDQARGRWDRWLVLEGLNALARAEALAQPLGPYALQAAIAACHARAHEASATDWPRIAALYDALVAVTESPVAALNHAMAVSMAEGPDAALPLVESLLAEPALHRYPWLPSAYGDLLLRLGRLDDARVQFERAATLTANLTDRRMLLDQAARCRPGSPAIQ
jgi:RNA polymerase sigma factor (sigma-70 family)